MISKESPRKIWIVTLFAAGMAFLETVIVVLQRMLYYPQGFSFPLNPNIQPWFYNMELAREMFTIIMLATIGYLAGKRAIERFGYFIYAFAIWDIFYYIWLKTMINWPASLMTWDLLFLMPLPWIGPVLAPIICSATMIAFHLIIVEAEDRGKKTKINTKELMMLVAGSAIILYTWLKDFAQIIINGGFLKEFTTLLTNPEFMNIVSKFNPTSYNWPAFMLGEALIILAIILYYKRNKRK